MKWITLACTASACLQPPAALAWYNVHSCASNPLQSWHNVHLCASNPLQSWRNVHLCASNPLQPWRNMDFCAFCECTHTFTISPSCPTLGGSYCVWHPAEQAKSWCAWQEVLHACLSRRLFTPKHLVKMLEIFFHFELVIMMVWEWAGPEYGTTSQAKVVHSAWNCVGNSHYFESYELRFLPLHLSISFPRPNQCCRASNVPQCLSDSCGTH